MIMVKFVRILEVTKGKTLDTIAGVCAATDTVSQSPRSMNIYNMIESKIFSFGLEFGETRKKEKKEFEAYEENAPNTQINDIDE